MSESELRTHSLLTKPDTRKKVLAVAGYLLSVIGWGEANWDWLEDEHTNPSYPQLLTLGWAIQIYLILNTAK